MSVKPKILIVDDEPINIKLLGQELKDIYQITFARDGEQALRLADVNETPDLILLDIGMEGMDGYQVCRELKSRGSTKHIPVIFITARDLEEDEKQGLAVGAVDYITKPFSLPIVKARVATHIELKKQLEDQRQQTLVLATLRDTTEDQLDETELVQAEEAIATIIGKIQRLVLDAFVVPWYEACGAIFSKIKVENK